MALRLLTYNVQGLADGRRTIAGVIRACSPDIACLQESPRLLRWRSRCAALSRGSGLWVVGGGWPAGLLVLGSLRTRVLHVESGWLSFVPRRSQRGLMVAVLEVAGARVIVADMHLDLRPEARARHVDEIVLRVSRLCRVYDAPVVVAGDVNEEPGGAAWHTLTRRFRDAYALAPRGGALTFTAGDPRWRIDGIFVDPVVGVAGCGVPDVPGAARASDHLPVVADLTL